MNYKLGTDSGRNQNGYGVVESIVTLLEDQGSPSHTSSIYKNPLDLESKESIFTLIIVEMSQQQSETSFSVCPSMTHSSVLAVPPYVQVSSGMTFPDLSPLSSRGGRGVDRSPSKLALPSPRPVSPSTKRSTRVLRVRDRHTRVTVELSVLVDRCFSVRHIRLTGGPSDL